MAFEASCASLAPLHQEKGPEAYEAMGGMHALARNLRIDLEKGVLLSEVEERRRVFGENRIASSKPKSFLAFFWESTKDMTIRLLCICAVTEAISAIVDGAQHGMTSHTTQAIFEGASIIGTVLLVCGIQSTQDYMKDRSFRKLNADVNHVMVNVVRDGFPCEVVRYDLVVGDVVTLNIGDILEADGILIAGDDVECDESALTGEPEDIKKDPVHVPFLFSGTAVKSGVGNYLVTSVGANTMSGRITALIRGQKVETLAQETGPGTATVEPGDGENLGHGGAVKDEAEGGSVSKGDGSVLQAKLEDMMRLIAMLAFLAAVVASLARLIMFWSINYGVQKRGWSKDDVTKMIKNIFTGIALVVVAIPEGLPLAVTLALSLSIKKMQLDNNLVKHLDATETMGSATTICSDKTGTLTQNRMTVMRTYIGGKEFSGEHSHERTCGKVMKSSGEIHKDVAEKLCLSISLNKGDGTDITWDVAADRWQQKGNKTDCALLGLAVDMGMDYQEVRKTAVYNVMDPTTGSKNFGIKAYPFSSSRKRSGQVVPLTSAAGSGPCRIYVKGASEMILKLATQELRPDGTVLTLTPSDRERIFSDAIDKFASQAMRTIGLAYRDFPVPPAWDEELDTAEAVKLTGQNAKTFKTEIGLTLLGICGIHDPIRDGVPRAIMQCNHAGVDVRMVTGDHKATAVAIAKECGILRRGIDYKDSPGEPLSHKFTAMTGEEFRGHVLDTRGRLDQGRFDEVWPYLRVLARSSPEDKHTLVTGLCESDLYATEKGKKLPIHQDRQVVAVTGDGTNDAPALRRAHVGFAMKITGTRVAQDAADILLLDDNFASVVRACMWGRNVYDSIAKFLQFQLTVNISAVAITLIGVFSYNTQPLSVVQMIWVNLIMDSLGALTFASEKPTESLLERAPYGRHRALLSGHMKLNMAGQAIYQLVVMLVILFAAAGKGCSLTDQPCEQLPPSGGFLELQSGLGYDQASEHLTFLFNAFVFMQLFNWINSRKLSHEWNMLEGLHQCYTFIAVWLVVLAIQILIVCLGSDAKGEQTVIGMIFQTKALKGAEWGICLGVGAFSLCWQWVVVAVGKLLLPAGFPKAAP